MKKLIIYYGDNPLCLEGFPKECQRTCDGSLHILPRKNKTLSDGEYEWLKKKHPEAMANVRVLAEHKEEPKKKALPAKVESSEEAKPTEEKQAKSFSKKKKKHH